VGRPSSEADSTQALDPDRSKNPKPNISYMQTLARRWHALLSTIFQAQCPCPDAAFVKRATMERAHTEEIREMSLCCTPRNGRTRTCGAFDESRLAMRVRISLSVWLLCVLPSRLGESLLRAATKIWTRESFERDGNTRKHFCPNVDSFGAVCR
jgi:hypothetical protein